MIRIYKSNSNSTMLEFALMHAQYTLAHSREISKCINHIVKMNAFGHDVLSVKLKTKTKTEFKSNVRINRASENTDIGIGTELTVLKMKQSKICCLERTKSAKFIASKRLFCSPLQSHMWIFFCLVESTKQSEIPSYVQNALTMNSIRCGHMQFEEHGSIEQ